MSSSADWVWVCTGSVYDMFISYTSPIGNLGIGKIMAVYKTVGSSYCSGHACKGYSASAICDDSAG